MFHPRVKDCFKDMRRPLFCLLVSVVVVSVVVILRQGFSVWQPWLSWGALFWIGGLDCARGSQNIQPIPVALGCSTEVKCKSLLMKTPCTSETWFWDPWAESFLPEEQLLYYQKVPFKFSKERGNQKTYPAKTSINHISDQHCSISLRMQ